MPAFRYRGRSAGGQVIEGTVDSPDRAGAIRLIESRRCFPIHVEPAATPETAPNVRVQGGGPRGTTTPNAPSRPSPVTPSAPRPTPPPSAPAAPPTPGGERLSHAQRLVFTEQLSYLLSGGMTLDVALGILAKRLKQPRLQRLIQSLHQGLVDGQSFSQALRTHPPRFSPALRFPRPVRGGQRLAARGARPARRPPHRGQGPARPRHASPRLSGFPRPRGRGAGDRLPSPSWCRS